ncbi:hypothetical protein ENUP19_0132G0012 [Entamoeba nuttalli]|uniref:Transmembrane protein n=2 Tax=Entamoeba nuttalli TaxID=412467 RepID=K2HHL2_ENTNP|nr:hypothetical protein ENU1_020730 [Entamoeba nuttalli P19]EKE42454.1 hypothetical protein ENU1_020730 [Entamoeba nuttalli P19]|eukprot:XP_008855212.1 hypothetical protein ENU1_020730 [Entamoeba nuttalli P19]
MGDMSEDDSSILIKDEPMNKEENTVDTILGTKALITTVSTISFVIYVIAFIILLMIDSWVIMLLMKIMEHISMKYIIINIPLIILSILIFIEVGFTKGTIGRIMAIIKSSIIIGIIPIISLRLDTILKGDVIYYFIPIFVVEGINIIIRINTFYFNYKDIQKHKEVFGYSWQLGITILSDISRIGGEILIILGLTEKSQLYENYLWCGIMFIGSLILYFIGFIFLKETKTYTGILKNIMRVLFIIYGITQILLIVLNTGKYHICSVLVASIPTLVYLSFIHLCFIVFPILYLCIFKKIVKSHLDDNTTTSFLHEN